MFCIALVVMVLPGSFGHCAFSFGVLVLTVVCVLCGPGMGSGPCDLEIKQYRERINKCCIFYFVVHLAVRFCISHDVLLLVMEFLACYLFSFDVLLLALPLYF